MMRKCALAVLSALVVVGCSSSSSSGTAGGGGGDGGVGSGNTNVCPKITQADIQALLTASISSIAEHDPTSTDFECDVGGLQIQMRTNDSSKNFYLIHHEDTSGNSHALQGYGDDAYWDADNSASGTCQSTPTVAVHKGSASCVIETDNEPSKYTMPYTPTPAPFGIANADAEAWSKKAATVCMEFFTAVGQ